MQRFLCLFLLLFMSLLFMWSQPSYLCRCIDSSLRHCGRPFLHRTSHGRQLLHSLHRTNSLSPPSCAAALAILTAHLPLAKLPLHSLPRPQPLGRSPDPQSPPYLRPLPPSNSFFSTFFLLSPSIDSLSLNSSILLFWLAFSMCD